MLVTGTAGFNAKFFEVVFEHVTGVKSYREIGTTALFVRVIYDRI